MIGPGKYDDLCALVQEKAKADGAVVMIFGGEKGGGFSAHITEPMMRVLPMILRDIADEIERGRKELG